MSSITNQIIANIKKTSTNFTSSNFINSENVICIDTSYNRIGINRKRPEYSIDISGDNSHNAIRVNNLYINNLAVIKEISSDVIDTSTLIVNNLDVSNLTFKLVSGDTIDVSFLLVNDISISKQFIPNISCNFLDVSNNINLIGGELIAKTITVDKITAIVNEFQSLEVSNIIVEISGYINSLENYDLSSNYISAYEISSNRLFVREHFSSLGEASFNNINIIGDASFNNLNAKDACFNEINSNVIKSNEISSNTIKVKELLSNGKSIINNGILGGTQSAIEFGDISGINLDICNIYIYDSLENIGVTNLSNGTLILPGHTSEYETRPKINQLNSGTITFDNSFNILKIYNNQWYDIIFNVNYINMKLYNGIPGNTISYDSIREIFFIEHSNNLILNNNLNFKYIPIQFDDNSNNNNNIFDLSNDYKTITTNNTTTNLFEIHATVSIKYLNKVPNDVEPNNYKFGIYPYKDITLEPYVELTNTVIVFDNSYNYANTTLNYIGPSIHTGFNFYISSDKDINYISIDKFNGTIKQL